MRAVRARSPALDAATSLPNSRNAAAVPNNRAVNREDADKGGKNGGKGAGKRVVVPPLPARPRDECCPTNGAPEDMRHDAGDANLLNFECRARSGL